VYESLVRSYLVSEKKTSARNLHKAALNYVAAPKQAEAAEKLYAFLTEREKHIYKRGRNTKVNSVPKNATTEQYHSATGFESLFGFLHLSGEYERIEELFNIIIGE